MKSYLVDFENVKSKGLVGIDSLTKDDHVVIFYSENSDTISFEMHCSVMRSAASVEYMKVNVGGKNALDFQLSTLLGYMVAKNLNSHIFIISNDKGFDKLHDFWENTFSDAPGCSVFRTHNIAAAINYAKTKKNTCGSDVQPRSKSAGIVVSSGESDAARYADGEPEFIVPEAMLERFRRENPDADIKEDPDENAESMNDAEDNVEAFTENFAQNTVVVTNAAAPSDQEPRFPQYLAPDEQPRGTAYYRELEFQSMEPAFRRFLRSPEAKDKRGLLKKYLPDESDEVIDFIKNALPETACRPELHNLLMKNFDEQKAENIFNAVKPYYSFLKRVLPEQSRDDAEPEKAAVSDRQETTEEQKNALPVPRKVDAEMKKRLHSLLDDIATPDEFSGIVAQMNQSATSQQLYINMVQRFRKARGCKLYKAVKNEFLRFISSDNSADMHSGEEYTEEISETVYDISAEPKKVDTAMKKKLHSLLDDVATPDEFSGVVAQINRSADADSLYSNMTQRFEKDRGNELFKTIENEYRLFIGQAEAGSPEEYTEEISQTALDIAPEPKKADVAMKKRLHSLLDDSVTPDEFSGVVAQINRSADTQGLWENMAQRFGNERGEELYAIIRDDFSRHLGEEPQAAEETAAKDTETSEKEKTLRSALDGKTTEDEFSEVMNIVKNAKVKHDIYLGMVKHFGKKRGIVIYSEIKNDCKKLLGAADNDRTVQ